MKGNNFSWGLKITEGCGGSKVRRIAGGQCKLMSRVRSGEAIGEEVVRQQYEKSEREPARGGRKRA